MSYSPCTVGSQMHLKVTKVLQIFLSSVNLILDSNDSMKSNLFEKLSILQNY